VNNQVVKKLASRNRTLLRGSEVDPHRNSLGPNYITISNVVILHQTVRAFVWAVNLSPPRGYSKSIDFN